MNLLIKSLAAVLLLVCMVVLPAQPADAATGCTIRYNKHVKDKAVVSASLDPFDSLVWRTNVRWSTRMYYRWCRNGARPDTVQFLALMFCGRKLDSGAAVYATGVKFATMGFDAFGNRMLRNNGWLKWRLIAGPYWYNKCKYYDFSNSQIMRRSAKPAYTVNSRVTISFQSDMTIHGINSVFGLKYTYDDRL